MKRSIPKSFIITATAVAFVHMGSDYLMDRFGDIPLWLAFLSDITVLTFLIAFPIWYWIFKPSLFRAHQKALLFEQAESQFGIVEVTDLNGLIKEVNDNFCKSSGYSREELIGKPHSLLNSGIHPQEFFGNLWETLLAKKVWTGEICNRAKDGHLFWLRTVIIPSLNKKNEIVEFFSIRQDVSEQHRLLETTRKSHERLELALHRLKFSIFEYNFKSGSLSCDELAFEIFGLSNQGFFGNYRFFQECVRTHDLIQINELLKAAFKKRESFDIEFNIRRASDSERRLIKAEVDINYDPSGLPVRLVGIVRDITEGRERELKFLHSAKMSSLGEMAAGIAHEVNNPLTIILGRVTQLDHMIEDQKVDFNELEGAADSIRKTAERIAKIVRGLRNFARDDGGDPMIITKAESILSDALDLCRSRFTSVGINFTNTLVNSNADIECRPIQITQVLLNLFSNAIDATSQLKDKWIHLEITEDQNSVFFKLTDSGQGIPRNLRDKILQPFFTTKEVGKGTGLGLSISNGIAKSHQGDLYIDDTCANTRFVLRLPKRQQLQQSNLLTSEKSA